MDIRSNPGETVGGKEALSGKKIIAGTLDAPPLSSSII